MAATTVDTSMWDLQTGEISHRLQDHLPDRTSR